MKNITEKYKTVSKLIATHKYDKIAVCPAGDSFYVHKRTEIYDALNPLTPYKRAFIDNNMLYIVL